MVPNVYVSFPRVHLVKIAPRSTRATRRLSRASGRLERKRRRAPWKHSIISDSNSFTQFHARYRMAWLSSVIASNYPCAKGKTGHELFSHAKLFHSLDLVGLYARLMSSVIFFSSTRFVRTLESPTRTSSVVREYFWRGHCGDATAI